MSGRIVVGIDGSEPSARALEWALARARLGGDRLEVVSAYSTTPALDFYGYHTVAAAEPVDWYAEYSRLILDAAAEHVREEAPDVACTVRSEPGHAATILAEASAGAEVVVVGRRGLGAAASALLGSVSNRLTIQAQCPVVVVGEGDLPTAGPVVVGVDGSEFGTNALRYALAEAALRETSVRAVVAYDFLHPAFRIDAELVARMRADAESEAVDIVTRALDEAREPRTASVEVEQVAVEQRAADAILEHATDAQLVVVGTHGRGLVRRMLMGSVSRQVLSEADRPVAVVDLPDH